MEPVILTASRGRVALRMTCVALGGDLSVTLAGGDREHIGAVALSQPRPSHRVGDPPSASTSVLVLLGHKEDDLARSIASDLACRLGRTVCVACGIHLEAISREELSDVLALAGELTGLLMEKLGAGSVDIPPGLADDGHPPWSPHADQVV